GGPALGWEPGAGQWLWRRLSVAVVLGVATRRIVWGAPFPRRPNCPHRRRGHARRTITAVTTSISWQDAFDVIKRGHEYRDVPFKLASGQTSRHYIDGTHAVDTGERLAVVCRAVIDLATERQIEFEAVGGLTMGADALAHGVAMVTGKAWFSVRKEPKSRGLEQFIEGFRLRDHPGTRVLLVEDVVSTGGS